MGREGVDFVMWRCGERVWTEWEGGEGVCTLCIKMHFNFLPNRMQHATACHMQCSTVFAYSPM